MEYSCFISTINPLSSLVLLRTLNLSNLDKIIDLESLSLLVNLDSLNLSYCSSILDIGPLGHLSQLQNLNLAWCTDITDFSALAYLTSLQRLKLRSCLLLTNLDFLSDLHLLKDLNISRCHRIKNFDVTVLTTTADAEQKRGIFSLRFLETFNCLRTGVLKFSLLAPFTALPELEVLYFAPTLNYIQESGPHTKEGCLGKIKIKTMDEEDEHEEYDFFEGSDEFYNG
eukprot:Awhi_evm1s12307